MIPQQQFRRPTPYEDPAPYPSPRGSGIPLLILLVLLFGLGIGIWSIFFRGDQTIIPGGSPSVESGKWQAVFLNGGQVYFGHLEFGGGEYAVLKDVYYLRAATSLQSTSSQAGFDLVKMGGELHGPEDTVYLVKSSMLFWENLRPDSRVVQTIAGYMARSGGQ